MKKRFLLPMLLMALCLFGSTASASPAEQTQTITLTDENRYDPVYYQEPEEIYPAAGKSRGAQVSLEEYVVSALEEFQETIDVSAYNVPSEDVSEIFFQILNDHPSLFYVKGEIKWYSSESGMATICEVTYIDTKENITAQKEEFDQAVDQALTWTDPAMTDLEKALAVHDYLVLNCEYDYERLSNTGTVPDVSHSAYGALIEKIAVCDGYAKAYTSILEKLGISSKIVSSDPMMHAWNLVLIDGNWYHVDATWDDPVWDSIGLASHAYFMLSDTVISNKDHEHYDWVSEYTADSRAYDEAFWSEINSAICYQQGNWYYSKANAADGNYDVNLMKKSELLGTQEEIVVTEKVWNAGSYFYPGSYMCLVSDPVKAETYFNTRTDIRKLGADGTITTVYQPECPEGQLIYGFTKRGNQLCYALQTNPYLEEKQKIQTCQLPEEPSFNPITGITAEGIETVYSGNLQKITVKGTIDGDKVMYKHSGAYQPEQPELKDAGTYQIFYRVDREGYESFYGIAKVIIRKAQTEMPDLSVLTGLQGSSGKLLKEVELPKGFVWERGSEKLKEEGEQTFYVSYVPEDSKNYGTISHIEAKIIVTCPGHQFTEKVIKKPTVTEEGQAILICGLCGHTENKTLPKLNPPDDTGSDGGSGGTEGGGNTGDAQNPGTANTQQKPEKISGLKVTKASANSLQFTWNAGKGTGCRLVLYKGSKAVSTVYTENNSCTIKKLKAATVYTVKATAYVEQKGTKLYASSETSLKVATAPGKVKLNSVKKKGSGKAKIAWKKTTGADGYEISMRTGKGSYKKIKTITKGKTTSFTKTGLKKGKSYSFRIRAYKKSAAGKAFGSYSSAKTLKMK